MPQMSQVCMPIWSMSILTNRFLHNAVCAQFLLGPGLTVFKARTACGAETSRLVTDFVECNEQLSQCQTVLLIFQIDHTLNLFLLTVSTETLLVAMNSSKELLKGSRQHSMIVSEVKTTHNLVGQRLRIRRSLLSVYPEPRTAASYILRVDRHEGPV
eukprot:497923-Hanusia_phi.AAC.1